MYAHIPRHNRYLEAQAKCNELEIQRIGRLETLAREARLDITVACCNAIVCI